MEVVLSDILAEISVVQKQGNDEISIKGIELDSRLVKNGFLFAAIPGTVVDGHQFIDKAIELGASAILCEHLPENISSDICYIQVESAKKELGKIASAFYENPSDNLYLVGVTGTNGKTTTATLLYNLFRKLGCKVGLLSTVVNYINEYEVKATHTTPNQVELNKLLAEMVNEGCEYCFMEVSSHAIDQGRISGLNFKGAVFTNLSHDHLDYHETFANYRDAKKRFFDELPKNSFALTNTDDKNGMVMLQNTKAEKSSYAVKRMADFKCKIIESHFDGMQLNIDNFDLWTTFVGEFNAYNLSAVYATARLLDQEAMDVLRILSELSSVSGRFETIKSNNGITAIVDYAHTPDALENVLKTISEIRTGAEKLITVVGAGGDRDKTKRPLMAKIGAQYSDRLILTSDNPRTEVPEAIIEDMKEGLDVLDKRKAISITDRREAIRTASMFAESGDIILIAGKGHETYQEVNGVRNHFDDREEIKECFKEL